jgi:hypothetical protein
VTPRSDDYSAWQSAMDALDYCWRQRSLMERYGLVPLILGVGAAWALLLLGVSPTEPSPALYAMLVFQTIIYLPPAVAWYRSVVYGEEAAWRPIFTFTRLEGRLLLWQVLLTIVLVCGMLVAALIIAGIGYGVRSAAGEIAAIVAVGPLALAAIAGFLMIATRLSMTTALATLDTPASFRIAWEMTRPIAWPLTGAIIIVSLAVVLFGACAELVAWLAAAIIAIARGSEIADVVPAVRVLAQAPTGLLWLFATATLFGFVYRSYGTAARDEPPAPASALE